MPTIGLVYRCTQMIPMRWSMKENLEKLSVGTWLRPMKDPRLSMDTMPSQKKNSASKSKIKTGMPCWPKFLSRLEISSMCQVGPCTPLVLEFWFLKPNSRVIPPTGFMILTARMLKETCGSFILKNQLMSWTLESLPIAIQIQLWLMIFVWPPWLPVISSPFISGNWLEKLILKRPLITACWAS